MESSRARDFQTSSINIREVYGETTKAPYNGVCFLTDVGTTAKRLKQRIIIGTEHETIPISSYYERHRMVYSQECVYTRLNKADRFSKAHREDAAIG